jgi:hypothetical protein
MIAMYIESLWSTQLQIVERRDMFTFKLIESSTMKVYVVTPAFFYPCFQDNERRIKMGWWSAYIPTDRYACLLEIINHRALSYIVHRRGLALSFNHTQTRVPRLGDDDSDWTMAILCVNVWASFWEHLWWSAKLSSRLGRVWLIRRHWLASVCENSLHAKTAKLKERHRSRGSARDGSG